MKKMSNTRCQLFFALFLLWTGIASAQIQKGTFFVESSFGNIGISTNKGQSFRNDTLSNTTANRSFSINLYPAVAYLITDNLALGAELDIYFGTSNYDYFNVDGFKYSIYKYNSISLGINPFARYYFGRSKNEKSVFFGQLGVGLNQDLRYRQSSETYDDAGTVTSTFEYDYAKPYRYMYASAMAGWNRMLSKNVALNLALGYRYMRTSQTYSYTYAFPDGTSTTSDLFKSVNTSGSLSWSGGMTMFIPTRKQ